MVAEGPAASEGFQECHFQTLLDGNNFDVVAKYAVEHGQGIPAFGSIVPKFVECVDGDLTEDHVRELITLGTACRLPGPAAALASHLSQRCSSGSMFAVLTHIISNRSEYGVSYHDVEMYVGILYQSFLKDGDVAKAWDLVKYLDDYSKYIIELFQQAILVGDQTSVRSILEDTSARKDSTLIAQLWDTVAGVAVALTSAEKLVESRM